MSGGSFGFMRVLPGRSAAVAPPQHARADGALIISVAHLGVHHAARGRVLNSRQRSLALRWLASAEYALVPIDIGRTETDDRRVR